MRSNYKQLGAYIERVDIRNKDLQVNDLRGLSMTKEFRKSTSNVVGTDMSRYKIVEPGKFACDFMSVIRVHKLPVVLNSEESPVIVSPAYTVFKVVDEKELLPEYLMMWFRRSEFDRYADFKCDSAIRGGFAWEELCEVELPVPTIDRQQEIVNEYNTVVNRIKLNEELNQKLEETAQALYKHWFVDFEFPISKEYAEAVGKPELEGQPYKSSGGKMVFDEQWGDEIPVGWKCCPINSLCTICSSKRIFKSEYSFQGVPFYRGKEITMKKKGDPILDMFYISEKKYESLVKNYGSPKKGDLLLTAVGTIGSSYLVQNERFYFKDGNIIWFKDFKLLGLNIFLYGFMQSESFSSLIDEITIGSTQSAITIKTLGEQNILLPGEQLLKEFQRLGSVLYGHYENVRNQKLKGYELKNILLTRMVKPEFIEQTLF